MSGSSSLSTFLDSLVLSAHRVRIAGKKVHPYFIMVGAALVAGPLVSWVFCQHMVGINFVRVLLIYFAVFLTYEYGYLQIKKRLLKDSARSFLQDTLFFLMPAYLLGSWLMGHSMTAAIDLLGLLLPTVLSMARIGCFCSGCCYGIPWKHGVLYPEELQVPAKLFWLRFTPGDKPEGRVLPIQLVECFLNLSLLGVLGVQLWLAGESTGKTLPLYLLSYGLFRLGAEFFRGTRHRPKWGPLSEAQWVSLIVVTVCVVVLSLL